MTIDAKKQEYWQRHIECQRQSGQRRAAYCRANDLVPHCFYYWEQMLNKRSTRATPQAQFLPVLIGSAAVVQQTQLENRAEQIRVILRDGTIIESKAADIRPLAALVAALRGRVQ